MFVAGYGAAVRVDADAELVAWLPGAVAGCLSCRPTTAGSVEDVDLVIAAAATGAETVVQRGDERVVVRHRDLAELRRVVLSEVHLAIAEHARGWLFVHAGAVAWHGRGIVLPGRSMAGKSTLVRALVEAGAEYFSDEYAVFDTAGRLHPYPKPLSLRTDAGAVSVDAASIGTVGSRPGHVALVAALTFDGRAAWAPQRVVGGSAVLALVEHTVAARRVPDLMVDVLGRVVEGASVVAGPRPDVADAVPHLLGLASRSAS